MGFTERHIVASYVGLFEGLPYASKKHLIETLSKSLTKEPKITDAEFFKSFGAFAPGQAAEEIIDEIKSSRKFRTKDLEF